jgi:short subunit dehydrogenase-like uncharacterized protein
MPAKILLWGATGFTGRLVAAELAARLPAGDQLILGGRNQERLAALAQGLKPGIEIRLADASDAQSLAALIDGIDVVATTVGPYRRYGYELAKACAVAGVDYVDLCGETPFIRQCIDELSETAQASGARLVHACGFDSIPSDLGVLALDQALDRAGLGPLNHARLTVRRLKGGLSGGTFASMLALVQDAVSDRELRRILANPYSLNPKDSRSGPRIKELSSARFDADHQRWTAPFIMAAINTRVVRRSRALAGQNAEDFSYDEAMACRSQFQARMISAGLKIFTLGAALAPSRALLKLALPKPGQGPSETERKNGCFELQIVARNSSDGPEVGRMIVGAQGDPGYSRTAVMLSESALCLAAGESSADGGIHTPASALGTALIERLRRADFRFEFQAAVTG